MMTSSSPAIRLRQANAQPCLSPATNAGSEAGRIRYRYSESLRRPIILPALSSSGGGESTPPIKPLATQGAAPRVIADKKGWVVVPDRVIADGQQAVGGSG